MTKLLLSLILTLSAYPAFAEMAAPDQALITECADNINPGKKLLSPTTADKCVKGLNAGSPTLLTKYAQEDPEGASILIGDNNALLDLKEIVVRQGGLDGVIALSRILEKPDCALCEMTLGPRPEAIFDWVGKYASSRQAGLKKDVRTWDALGHYRMTSLASAAYGKTKADWNSQAMVKRYLELGKWAASETTKIAAAPKVPANFAEVSAVLREDLEAVDDAASLTKLSGVAAKAGIKEEAPKPSTADKKGKQLAAAGNKLASIDQAGRGEYLTQAFDGAGALAAGALPAVKPVAGATAKPGTAKPGAPITPVQMTAAEEKALGQAMIRMEKGKPVGYMADVMNQSEAGKRTNAFYSDPKYAKAGTNKLDFSFTRSPGAFGYWDPDAKVVRINSEVAEEFAAKRGMTVPQLMKDKKAMQELAVMISPVMVHEAEHQNQTARAVAAGVDFKKFSGGGSSDPYTRAKENLSNTESAKHMIEYCSKNGGPACWKSFHPMHADNAEKFMAGGVEALDALKAPLYPRIDSFEGGTAREFQAAQTYAKQLKALETLQRSSPKTMTAEQRQNLADYRVLMDTRFKWYTISYQENSANDAEALAFRKKYGTAASGLAVPTL
ncbi:MAG: hypothetical protein A2089_13650 [Elusimicrobia bacterium GWD2_63_28]|nr:MAG: hypothetical protein A2089_13650 [Elusimicrobia bacterium GWD2_63_28]